MRRLVPVAQALVGKVKAVAIVSAVAALVLWGLLFRPLTWTQGASLGSVALALVVLLVLLIPAGAALVGYLTLQDVLTLPARLRSAAAETTGQTKDALTAREPSKRRRLFSFFRAIWAARSLAVDSKGAWLKAVAAARVVRLASLPFALGLLAAFALNFAVIAAAVLAVLLTVLF